MPRLRKNEISVSGDYLLGQGNVTMPFGFSLAKVPGLGANINETVAKPDRSSTYFGGTLSYSYGQAWYLDLGYAHGTSSGTTDILLGENTQPLPSQFSIDDNWYQAYVRYTPKRLRGQKLSGYLRAGFSYVTAELHDTTVIPAVGLYHQDDKTTDYLGNIGAGIGYTFWRTRHIRMMAQAEAEGFYGHRTQKSHEVLQEAGPGFPFPTANIDNDLYGGIGRGTLRFEYRFDSEGAYKAFIDGGMQAKFTEVGYPGGLGSFNELLWGPYVRAGLRFSF